MRTVPANRNEPNAVGSNPGRPTPSRVVSLLGAAILVALPAGIAADTAPSAPEAPPPSTPREFFNAGTRKLQEAQQLAKATKPIEAKLREAEALFETALSSQNDRFQPPALYNLGHVRFGQGIEVLKKGPAGGPTAAKGRAAAQAAEEAIASATDALAGDDVQKMVNSYMNGRGARKELKAAIKAVKRALETHGVTLNKWQRSSGDFKSTVELRRSDADARQNADTVDRCIAKLIDTLRELEMAANAMGDKQQDLGEKLKQLKGRIPAPDMPPGAAGEDEDDEDKPNGPKQGEKEGPSKDGKEEMALTPEQASWLLEGFKLDGDRRLPMGVQETPDPKPDKRRTW
jgi:hypothetical protein